MSLEISMFSWISSSVNLNIPNTHLVWLFLPKKKQQSDGSYQTDGLYNQKVSAESCSTLQALFQYHKGTNTNDMSTIKSQQFQRMPHSFSSSLLLVGHLTWNTIKSQGSPRNNSAASLICRWEWIWSWCSSTSTTEFAEDERPNIERNVPWSSSSNQQQSISSFKSVQVLQNLFIFALK